MHSIPSPKSSTIRQAHEKNSVASTFTRAGQRAARAHAPSNGAQIRPLGTIFQTNFYALISHFLLSRNNIIFLVSPLCCPLRQHLLVKPLCYHVARAVTFERFTFAPILLVQFAHIKTIVDANNPPSRSCHSPSSCRFSSFPGCWCNIVLDLSPIHPPCLWACDSDPVLPQRMISVKRILGFQVLPNEETGTRPAICTRGARCWVRSSVRVARPSRDLTV
jgi:hypothetical protein